MKKTNEAFDAFIDDCLLERDPLCNKRQPELVASQIFTGLYSQDEGIENDENVEKKFIDERTETNYKLDEYDESIIHNFSQRNKGSTKDNEFKLDFAKETSSDFSEYEVIPELLRLKKIQDLWNCDENDESIAA